MGLFNRFLNIGFFTNLLVASSVELVLAAVVNMRDFWIYPFESFINSILALGTLLAYFYLIRKVFVKSMAIERFKKTVNE
jgi:uncharacterized membrane protein (DUF106 family)